MDAKDIIIAILTGGIGASLVKCIFDLIAWRNKRKADKEDRECLNTEQRLKKIEQQTKAQSEALKFLLYDRIKYLGQCYIRDNEIDIDDRRILNDMHSSYHNGLNGNGDLDLLMSAVNKLPLKIEK